MAHALTDYPHVVESAWSKVDELWRDYFAAKEAQDARDLELETNAEGSNATQRKAWVTERKAEPEYQALHSATVGAKTAVNLQQYEAERLQRQYEVALAQYQRQTAHVMRLAMSPAFVVDMSDAPHDPADDVLEWQGGVYGAPPMGYGDPGPRKKKALDVKKALADVEAAEVTPHQLVVAMHTHVFDWHGAQASFDAGDLSLYHTEAHRGQPMAFDTVEEAAVVLLPYFQAEPPPAENLLSPDKAKAQWQALRHRASTS